MKNEKAIPHYKKQEIEQEIQYAFVLLAELVKTEEKIVVLQEQ